MGYHKLLEISNNRPQSLWLCATGISDGITTLSPGIWYYPLTIIGDPFQFDTEAVQNDRDYNTVRYTVNSLSAGADDYTEATSFSDLETQNKSFFFDDTNPDSLRIYVHFDGLEPPNTFSSIFVGLTIPFCMTSDPDGYTNETGIFYAPRVASISEITDEVDPLFFGITRDQTCRITLLNHEDATLDDIGKSNLFGNPAEILIVPEGQLYANAEKVFFGRVANIPRVGQDVIEIELQNERRFLTRQIPENFYSNTDAGSSYYYAYLNDKYNGKPTPLIFGKVKGVPCIPLNEEASPSTYTFQVCETDISSTVTRNIDDITKVYTEDGEDITAHITANLSAGTFTVAEDYVEQLDDTGAVTGRLKKIYADVSGYEDGSGNLVENGLEILRLMLLAFYGYSYTASVYNTSEWDAAEANAYSLGYYIDDVTTLREAIEDLSASLLGNFMIQGNGLITFRKRDITQAADYYLKKQDNFEPEAADYDSEQFLSSATVKHSRDWGEKEFRSLTNTEYESDVFARYRTYRPKTFETYINNLVDAQDFADTIMAWKKDINPSFSVVVPFEYRDIELNNVVLAEIRRYAGEFYGDVRAWVRRRGMNLNDDLISLEVEYIEDVTLVDSDNIDPSVYTEDFDYLLSENGENVFSEDGVEWAVR